MRLAIVSDEICPEFDEAVRVGTGWGIEWFEVRSLPSGRIPDVAQDDLDVVTRLVEEQGVKVSAVSPGVFKVPEGDPAVPRQLGEVLPKTYELARRWGASVVIVFSFGKDDPQATDAPDAVLEALRRTATEAAQAGLRVAVENEGKHWASTGARCAALLRAVDHENLCLNWDPGNAIAGGDTPYPDGYEAAREWVGHLHIKDERRSGDGYEVVLPGDGVADWPGQFRALLEDGFEGFYTVETHFGEPRLPTSEQAVARVKRMLRDAEEGLRGPPLAC